MANNKMLIDAAHPEETRVVMVRGNRIDEFDFESEHKTQLRGNIYLAKVTRVEPSLQAAFVDYGGNRHGFLAFSEIHPDYYQIPIADRQALLDAEAEDARVAAAEEDNEETVLEARSDADGDENSEETQEKPARKRRSRRRSKKAPVESKGDESEADSDKPKDEAVSEESDNDDSEMSADNENDDVVSEPAVEPVKKTRRKTTRKKADSAKEADASASVDASDKETDEKPAEKPKRRRTTKKTATSKASKEETASESTAETEESADVPAKPKRRATTRKKPAAKKTKPVKEQAETNSTDAKSDEADSADAEKPAKTPRRRTSRKAKEPKTETKTDDVEGGASNEDTAPDKDADDAVAAKSKDGKEKKAKPRTRTRRSKKSDKSNDTPKEIDDTESDPVEDLGSQDAMEEVPARRRTRRKSYKIQEVIKRRQILLVQVVKEERGTKGAALTTYLSLAGRYSVLMPNTARGGGISRKITNVSDRKRLKAVASELQVPDGMGVILRTAGATRSPDEIQRDFEYLMRLWENVRTLTLESTAPCLVYEEGSLIKRSIRDLYDKDTGEVLVAGEMGHQEAKNFMAMLIPTHAKNVKLYKDKIPLFARMGVEAQLDAMLQPQVTLKSGGYLIIDQTEALVAIDVNSGRSTRQHSIEETATQTNLEAADEVARQLRLRDLAGLIVIDFIDMEERRNIRAVEKRLKEALKHDRARIQVGKISHFGLMEMSRQRIRASVLESTTQTCPICEGLGHVRSSSSVALSVIRAVEDHLNRNSRNNIVVKASTSTALYLLNNKREQLSDMESRFGVSISVETSETLGTTPCLIEKGELSNRKPAPTKAVQADTQTSEIIEVDAEVVVENPHQNQNHGDSQSASPENGEGQGRKKRRRRRRRRGKGTEDKNEAQSADNAESSEAPTTDAPADVTPQKENSTAPAPKTVESDSAATDVEEPKPANGRRTRRKTKETEKVEEVSASAEPETPPMPKVTDTEEEPKKSKRTGWWQRKFF